MSLRIHCFQHVHFEDLGCIKDWINSKGHYLKYTRFYANDPLPDTDDFDWLIIMGGPMGIFDYDKYPWLKEEKKVITKAIVDNKTIIGICLGAQLIADVLGAKVFPGKHNEIGWFNLRLTAEGKDLPALANLPADFKVFHWHGDTFNIPNGAIGLAQSELTPNQGFLYNNKVLAFQFHFEVTEDSLKAMIANGGHELLSGKYVQNANEIMGNTELISQNNNYMFSILNAFNTQF